jgi:hypothetical protein
MSSGFSHRTPDFGVLPFGSRLPALPPIGDAVLPLALTLLVRSLTLVCTQLSVVGCLLAIVCDAVPLIGDAFSFVSYPLASCELTLAPRESIFALM